MQRRIVEPADVGGTALAELKSWLGISRSNEDALLEDLLKTSLAMCEAFTGQAPLSQRIEERLPTHAGQFQLTSRPVLAVLSVEIVAQNGNRSALSSNQYETEIQADGHLCFTLKNRVEGQSVALTATAGLSGDWEGVPAALKQGIIRLSAYYYRDRDRPGDAKKLATPPTIVSALWRPYQTLRLT